jgi:DDE superfamily endonuclease
VIRKKKWISKDKRPVVKVTGSRNKTIIFGCLSIEGKQLFRQYKKFDSTIFVDYLKQLQERFGKCIVFVDRATPHCSKVTKAYLDANKDTIRLEYFFLLDLQNLMHQKNIGDKVSIIYFLVIIQHLLI